MYVCMYFNIVHIHLLNTISWHDLSIRDLHAEASAKYNLASSCWRIGSRKKKKRKMNKEKKIKEILRWHIDRTISHFETTLLFIYLFIHLLTPFSFCIFFFFYICDQCTPKEIYLFLLFCINNKVTIKLFAIRYS